MLFLKNPLVLKPGKLLQGKRHVRKLLGYKPAFFQSRINKVKKKWGSISRRQKTRSRKYTVCVRS